MNNDNVKQSEKLERLSLQLFDSVVLRKHTESGDSIIHLNWRTAKNRTAISLLSPT